MGPGVEARPNIFFQASLSSANPDAAHTADARRLVDELLYESGLVGMFENRSPDTDTSHDHEWAALDVFADDS